VGGVGIGEEELELFGSQLARDRVRLACQLEGELRVLHRSQLDEVAGSGLELLPLRAFGAEGRRLLGIATGLVGIVPDARLGEELL
jgi:hypothetical protein